MRRALVVLLAVGFGGLGTLALASAPRAATTTTAATTTPSTARGRSMFVASCASCHGQDARGVRGRGPSLVGVGALAADFELRTGRMPLAAPHQEPMRHHPAFSGARIADLVAYIGSLGGPPVPVVSGGSVRRGHERFADSCAGCHQIVGRGGIATGAVAPALQDATPVQVAEAVRLGPYLMPRFGPRQLTDGDVADLAAYVTYTRHLQNPGGWAIGNLGPVPEGLVCWGIAMVLLLGAARSLGERAR